MKVQQNKVRIYEIIMQVKQIQSQIDECRELLQELQQYGEKHHWEQYQAEWLKKQIRQRRVAIGQMKYELKKNVSKNVQKKQFFRTVDNLQKQIRNTITINTKICEQYKQLTNVCMHNRNKIDAVQRRINNSQKQIALYEKYYHQGEILKNMDMSYWDLRSQIEGIIMDKQQDKQRFRGMFKDKEGRLIGLQKKVQKIDEKYRQTDDKVRVQRELIDSILKNEEEGIRTKTENLSISSIEKGNVYTQLEPIQKIEIQNIAIKKKQEEKDEKIRMGTIIKQNSRTEHIGKIVSLQRNKLNISDQTRRTNSYTEPASSSPFILKKLSEQSSRRIKDLEKNKRIRTKESQMKRFSQQYKNIGNQGLTSPILRKPQRSILEVYEQLKTNKRHLSKKATKNIEIIKFLKTSGRRKEQSKRQSVLDDSSINQ